MRRWYGWIVGVALGLLVCAAPASAADTFVDDDRPDDTANCLTPATACKTIAGAIPKAGAGDTVHIAEGTYSEPQLITNGRSLESSGAAASTIVTPNAAVPALIVTNGAASSVEGLTIRCDVCSIDQMDVNAPGTIRGNVFDGDGLDTMILGDLAIRFNSGAVTVDENTFTDPVPNDTQIAINLNSANQPAITDNQITGFTTGIEIDRAAAGTLIRGNTFAQIHNVPGIGVAIVGSPAGNNATTDNVAPDIVGNTIHNPVDVGGINPVPRGIALFGDFTAGAPTFGASLRRNRITGHNPAVSVGSTDGPVTLDSDLLVGAPDGLSMFTNNSGNDFGNVTATNITAVGGSRAIVLQHTHLVLDSSIVDASIMDAGSGPADTSSCAITNSRGQAGANPPTGNGCDGSDFATAASPTFVDPGAGNYHLQAGSPMIDAGNPSDPGAGVLDFDGDPRAVAGTCGSPVRRDIGADEFVPADCVPPDTQIGGTPANDTVTSSRSADLTFTSSEPGSTFECAQNGVDFTPCTSPFQLSGLPDGNQQIFVRARDAAGNVDPSSALHAWRVDGTAPETSIDSGPADGASTETAVSYGFSSNEAGATFECAVDGGGFTPCTSPASVDGLAAGEHVFRVRATDGVGNVDASPAQRTLVVTADQADTDPPETTIRRTKVKGDEVKVRFASDEPGSTFRCRLDRKAFRPCTSPKRYRKLADGRHRVFVLATDAAGNEDDKPAKARFEVGR